MDSPHFESMVQAMVQWGEEPGARKKGAAPSEPEPKVHDDDEDFDPADDLNLGPEVVSRPPSSLEVGLGDTWISAAP